MRDNKYEKLTVISYLVSLFLLPITLILFMNKRINPTYSIKFIILFILCVIMYIASMKMIKRYGYDKSLLKIDKILSPFIVLTTFSNSISLTLLAVLATDIVIFFVFSNILTFCDVLVNDICSLVPSFFVNITLAVADGVLSKLTIIFLPTIFESSKNDTLLFAATLCPTVKFLSIKIFAIFPIPSSTLRTVTVQKNPHNINVQIRVGIINVVTFWIANLFIENVIICNIIAYTFSISSSFVFNKKLVFKKNDGNILGQGIKYLVVKLLAFVLDSIVLVVIIPLQR